jgi:hypothetical protein
MLRGLPGIRLKLEFVKWNPLGEHSLILALVRSFHLRDRSTNTIFWLAPPHVIHVVHLAYLNEMQDASVWIYGNAIDDALHTKQDKYKVTLNTHKHFTLLK